ncbi:MAG: hypothetical protein IPK73_31335 [Candidatus Obscuribacter sp.]|nr:hypothetical protein [Candidatus Obscuribacter sp.]
MTPPEQIIEFLRDHPDSTRAQISEHCGHERNWAWRWVRVLVLQGNVVSRTINKNDVRYTLIDDAIKDIRVDGRYNATIRSLVEFEKFQKDVRPMIEAMPGRSAAFYAEMLGQHISSVSRRLNEMQRMGILFSDRRRRKRMKNKTALWWIKGCEPEDMDSVETPEEQIIRQSRKSEKNTQPAYQEAADYLNDDQWVNEISKSREQRRLERLRAQDAQMPIPSYAEFFRQQAGRN